MGKTARKAATYEDLRNLPENMTGEIVDGELYALPRPSPRHGKAASVLAGEIEFPFQFGRNGPGGWLILFEPELRLGAHTVVPDLAAWKKERLPRPPETNWISVPPDWVCEVLSQSTIRLDRLKKMPIYAQFGVSFIWLVDPVARTLEVFRLESGHWLLTMTAGEDQKVRAEPFQEIEIDLSNLWWD
jgi:Uma2 family endonuclease